MKACENRRASSFCQITIQYRYTQRTNQVQKVGSERTSEHLEEISLLESMDANGIKRHARRILFQFEDPKCLSQATNPGSIETQRLKRVREPKVDPAGHTF